jgi:DNA-binding transcriptional LysR family regulator
MNYHQVKVFITVAEKKSFSETAKILHMSQPTVTSQIKALEAELNTKLLNRNTKNVELTSSGEIFFRHGKEILNITDLIQKEISGLSDTLEGVLVVGASLTTGEVMLPQFLGSFTQQYPKIRISIEVTNTEQIVSKIRDGILDIGLIEAPITASDLKVVPFRQDELVLIASSDFHHPLLDEKYGMAKPQLLLDAPLILREVGSGTRKVLEEGLNRIGMSLDHIQPFIELGSTEAIKSLVEQNLGVSVISRIAIDKELKLQSLKMYRFQHMSLIRQFFFVHKKKAVLPLQAEVFIKELSSSEEAVDYFI